MAVASVTELCRAPHEKLQTRIADLSPQAKDNIHTTSKRYLACLHALTLTETHVLGEAPAVTPLTGEQRPFPATLANKTDDIFKLFGDVAGTTKNFIQVMETLRTAQEERMVESTITEDLGRTAIAQGYNLAHTTQQGAQYISRLTHFADEFRRLLVSSSPGNPHRVSSQWRTQFPSEEPIASR